MALIMVLLLLAVVSSLAAGLTMNSQVEVSMASNETSYAGARAAAEAGMNRAIAAIVADTNTDLLAEALANGGRVDFLFDGEGPYLIGVNDEYSYVAELFDDDDPVLYATALTNEQITNMGEDGDPATNLNERLILRVTGFGPNGTVVRIGRIVESVPTTDLVNAQPPTLLNPALLVDGDLSVAGHITIAGDEGNVHANGNMTINGNAWTITGDATASGTFDADHVRPGGLRGGGFPTVNVPDINANDYYDRATHVLRANGTILTVATGMTCSAPCLNWSFSGGTWDLDGNTATHGTFFAETDVRISGNPGGVGKTRTPQPMSIIALGSIEITGRPALTPHESANALQFVTNGDLKVAGNVQTYTTTEDDIEVEGQSLVREQLFIHGTPVLRGQIIVQDVRDCDPCSNLVTANSIAGNMTIRYNGSFDELLGGGTPGGTGATTFTNNVTGWIEGL
jgi:hypothetical protein